MRFAYWDIAIGVALGGGVPWLVVLGFWLYHRYRCPVCVCWSSRERDPRCRAEPGNCHGHTDAA